MILLYAHVALPAGRSAGSNESIFTRMLYFNAPVAQQDRATVS